MHDFAMGNSRTARAATLVIMLLLLFSSGCAKKEQERKRPDAPVSVAQAKKQDVPRRITAIGTIEAYSTVNVTPRADGQVLKIHILEGQTVARGQILITLDDGSYQAALEAALSSLSRDKIQLKKAKKDAIRFTALAKKEVVTKDQAEKAQTDAQAMAEQVKSDEALVKKARLNLSYCTITSPVSGRAGSILIDEGNVVRANDTTKPLMVINQIQPVYVRFSVPEQDLPEIRNQIAKSRPEVRVFPPGKPDAKRKGKLTFFDNAIDPQTGTIALKAEFPNTDKGLWPGQFVNVILTLGMDRQAVTVPSSAVQMGQQGYYLFVVKKDLSVESRAIVTGPQVDGYTVIDKGLDGAETVVTDGQLRLYTGVKVTVKPHGEQAKEAMQ